MQNEIDIIRDVSRRMDDAGIAYMLTGSMAMNYYAQPRMTRGIDLVVALTAAEAGKIIIICPNKPSAIRSLTKQSST